MAPPRSLVHRARAELHRWRRTLPHAVRAELRDWREAPIILVGIAVDPEAERDHALWTAQLREYVNSHEEIGFFLQERQFQICRAHAVARDVIETGLIATGFRCPRQRTTCPFARASALVPGRALALTGR